MVRTRVFRVCPGMYEVVELGNTIRPRAVDVVYHEHLRGWVAQARWDRFLYTDVLRTKREAVLNAKVMIREAVDGAAR